MHQKADSEFTAPSGKGSRTRDLNDLQIQTPPTAWKIVVEGKQNSRARKRRESDEQHAAQS